MQSVACCRKPGHFCLSPASVICLSTFSVMFAAIGTYARASVVWCIFGILEDICAWSQALLAKRQEQLASLQLPPPPPQDCRPQAGGQSQGQYQRSSFKPHQGGRAGNQAQVHSGSQMPHMHHQPRPEPLSRYQQLPSQQHQHQYSWGTQEPIRYPGAKPADRGRPVYSAPYTVPYYAAQYSTPQQPPQQSAASGHVYDNSQSGFGSNIQAGAAHTYQPPALLAPGQQKVERVVQERVDPRRHLPAYKNRPDASKFVSDRHIAGGPNQMLSHQTPHSHR